jgi:hypothetical protein
VLRVVKRSRVTTSTEPDTLGDRPPPLDRKGAVVPPLVHDFAGLASATSTPAGSDAVTDTVNHTASAAMRLTIRAADPKKKRIVDCPVTVKGDSQGRAIRSSLCH